jgi:hypothetical protein
MKMVARRKSKFDAEKEFADGIKETSAEAAKAEKVKQEKEQKQIDVLVKAAKSDCGLFHDESGVAYVDLSINNHRETWPVNSRQFRSWLMRYFWERQGSTPNPELLSTAVRMFEAMALFDGQRQEVYLRVAPAPGGGIYLDLCDADWKVVWVGTDSWSVVKDPQVRFIRRKGMLPLPVPAEGGSIDELRPFINVKNDSDFVLVVAWLLAAFRDHGPYPILMAWGEAGSAKSSSLSVLRKLIDPAVALLRAPPREDRDLFIAANNGWVPTFDNISYLPDWLSDTLARLATGGGFGTRQLYSDDEERLFNATRPILLGGIENVVIRGDLADRAVLIQLEHIPDDKRRLEKEFWAEFERVRPSILGALLSAVSAGLKALPTVKLEGYPRMADFAQWAVACETVLGPPGTFMTAYLANRQSAIVDLVEGSVLASALSKYLKNHEGEFNGTATDLLVKLNDQVTEQQQREKSWPKAAHVLSGKLTRLRSDLRKVGIEISDGGRDDENRKIIEVRQRALGALGALFPNDASRVTANATTNANAPDNALGSRDRLNGKKNNADNAPNASGPRFGARRYRYQPRAERAESRKQIRKK